MSTEAAPEKRMHLRYAGDCRLCGAELPARTEAVWERATKTVRCVECPTGPSTEAAPAPTVVDPGVPGASARREYERRKAKDEQAVRDRHPRTAGLRLALRDERRSTKSWDTGAIGEEQFGARLQELSSDRLRVLHDRRIPGRRSNIDHVAVSATGVWILDPKRYRGKRPSLRVEGGILRPRTERLVVAGRDQTKLVEGVLRQVDVVRALLDADVPVRGVLCFIEADWPLFGGDFVIDGVEVLWPRRLYPRLEADGPLDPERIESIHRRLAAALPPA